MAHLENRIKSSTHKHVDALSGNSFCSLLDHSYEKCWFQKLIKADIPKIAYYCGAGHHSECEIYIEYHRSQTARFR